MADPTHLSGEVDGEQAVLSAVQFGECCLGHRGLPRANRPHQQHWTAHPHQVLDQEVITKSVYGRDYDLVEWSADWEEGEGRGGEGRGGEGRRGKGRGGEERGGEGKGGERRGGERRGGEKGWEGRKGERRDGRGGKGRVGVGKTST